MKEMGEREKECVCVSERQCPDCDFTSRLTSVSAVCVCCGCSADADGFKSAQDTDDRLG